MRHNDDAFATMLLMCQIDPSREELVRPLSISEWHALRERVEHSPLGNMGALLRTDMSELMQKLAISEEDAYRICVLLGRTLPLSMLFERIQARGIDMLTLQERNYPQALEDRLGVKAPPLIYLAGRSELFRQSAIAIIGALEARGDAEARVRGLARAAVQAGYVVITDGARGLGRIAEDEVRRHDGRVLSVLGGALSDALDSPLGEMVRARQAGALSLVHPDAPYTLSHALERNKLIYALAQAVFVFACDDGRGATWEGAREALNAKWCNFVYCWDTALYRGNRPLIARGASVMPDLEQVGFEQLSAAWRSALAEQLSLFDDRPPRKW